MRTLYDSAWVPAASGAINAVVGTDGARAVRIILAASGSGGSAGSLGFSAGMDAAFPVLNTIYTKAAAVAYPALPKITASYAIGAPPAANDWHAYYLGPNLSGVLSVTGASANTSAFLDAFVPDEIYATLSVSASSWGRVIVEAE